MKSKKKQTLFKEITKQDVERVDSLLNEYSISAYVNADYSLNTIYIDIDWGDWKHDHLYIRHLLSTIGFNEIREDVIGSTDSDYYKSEHTFMYASEDAINSLKEMFS
jgi:hypothetical protein